MRLKVRDFELKQMADSGQCFRWHELDAMTFDIVAHNRVLRVAQTLDTINLDCTEEEFKEIWEEYFDLKTDYRIYKDTIEQSKDDYLTAAVRTGSGIRILKQDPWEMLITFITSQQMQIPRIKQLIERLCSTYGSRIADTNYYTFPDSETLYRNYRLKEELESMGFGYRAKYIADTVRMVANHEIDLSMPYLLCGDCAVTYLKRLTGVGDKVANCIALFGYHKIDTFPVDTWIKRIIDTEYNGNFDRDRYKGFEGIVQQYMFYYQRTVERKW